VLHQSIRVLAFVFGLLMFIGGLAGIGAGGAEVPSVVFAIAIGAAVMIAAVLQRSGYRSEAAERSHVLPGPGGGEDGYVEPRFAPTDEVFVDPTSQLLMRVYEDRRTGERRYRAER
jgi:hypothetical protein